MATFAHIESGRVIDPMAFASEAAYLANFAAGATAAWQVVQVPDGTAAGSLPDGQGGWTAPAAAPAPALIPLPLTDTEFADYCYAQLGAIAAPSGTAQQQLQAGMGRRGAILLACKNTNDPFTFEAYTRFTKATTYELLAVATFLVIIGPAPGSGITTAAENAALIGNWKTG